MPPRKRNSRTKNAKVFNVIVSPTSPYYRQMVDGVLEMARELHCSHPVAVGFPEALGKALAKDCIGVISGVQAGDIDLLQSFSFPVVNVSNSRGPIPGLLNFLNDDEAIGRMAAQHMMQQGYRSFLCLATADENRVHEERAHGFATALAESGFQAPCHFISMVSDLRSDWTRYRFVHQMSDRLRPHLQDIAPDTGIFATNDWMAWVLMNVLHIDHPELLQTVGVLGVDNDNEGAWYGNDIPELSSIVPAFHEIGREALRWLNENPGTLGKAEIPQEPRRFPPAGLVQRSSTACGGCRDPMTAKMVRWAWNRIQRGRPVSVAHIAAHFHMSRKTIYRHFVQHRGMAPVDVLDLMRLDLARHLLRSTRLSIGEISDRCGFAKQDVLSRLMKRKEKCTPLAFRRKHQSFRSMPDALA